MSSIPPLQSTAQRRRAFALGQVEVVVGEVAYSRRRGVLRARPLHLAQATPATIARQAKLTRQLSAALTAPPWASQHPELALPPPALACAIPRSSLPRSTYPSLLVDVGPDRFGRPCRLQPAAAKAWRRMHAAAEQDQISLELVSGFRSVGYQQAIWRRKLSRGQSAAAIARVSAVPGYSEHHSGRALDLASGPGPVLEQAFAKTPAYRWLCRHAGRYGFRESYPGDNPFGIIAEPWHWCWQRSLQEV